MVIPAVLAVIVVGVLAFVVAGFNKLKRSDIRVDEALGGIDVQLTRRADLIPNLVEVVKGYAGHERGVLDEVTTARAGVQHAIQDSVTSRSEADAAMQRALLHMNAVAEAYPDLKASTNFAQLQQQLAETEQQLSFARQYYNDAVATLNGLVETIPWMFLTGLAGVRSRSFYDAPVANEAPPSASFG